METRDILWRQGTFDGNKGHFMETRDILWKQGKTREMVEE